MMTQINVKNMRRLRWRLQRKNDPVQFRMQHWWSFTTIVLHSRKFKSIYDDRSLVIDWDFISEHPCQSAACMAGFAVIIAIESGDIKPVGSHDVHVAAQEWLGMDYINANRLFLGRWMDATQKLENVTKAEAVEELTKLINDYEEGI